MRPARMLLPIALAALTALAGCASKPAGGAPTGSTLAGGLAQHAHGLWNYTTPDPGGARYAKDYAGTLTPQEASGAEGGLPLGLSPPVLSTCCYLDWVDAPDLVGVDQLVSLRITLNWTNSDGDHAGLDAAACLPWHCAAFNRGPDESLVNGPHSDVLTLITSGRQAFLDAGGKYQLGVRYSNAVLSGGLAYTLHVEAAPVGNGLALQEAYMLHVAPNATVQAQLVGPYSPDGVQAGLMVYGEGDRPVRWIPLSGPDGARFNLTLPAGTPVVVPFSYGGGFVRLATDRQPAMAMAHRLKVEDGLVELAAVPDAQAHSGEVSYAAPAGSMGDFPWFLYADGAAAQSLFGLEPEGAVGANVTLASSRGLVAAVDEAEVALHTPITGQSCLTCQGNGRWWPQNYLDDDGTYQVHWSSSGAAGRFVLFTQRYVR